MSLAHLLAKRVPLAAIPPALTHYSPGTTPLSTWPSVLLTLACYFAAVFGLQDAMRARKALRLAALFRLHNAVLSAGSLVLLVLIVEEVVPLVHARGLFFGICGQEAWTPRLEFYYMINYYFKYLELLDTVFLVVKKKQLTFLHVFHHSATALLCFVQLNGRTSGAWVPIVLNLTVHVFMYYYYYATAGGHKIWWKKYLTIMQIIQFVIDIAVGYFAVYNRYAALYFPRLPNLGTCATSDTAVIFGLGLITSYLFLFVAFYKSTYRGAGERQASR